MQEKLQVTIATPTKTLFSGKAYSVYVPGELGEMEILPGHESIITTLKPGKIKIKTSNDLEVFDVDTGGILEHSNNQTTILLR